MGSVSVPSSRDLGERINESYLVLRVCWEGEYTVSVVGTLNPSCLKKYKVHERVPWLLWFVETNTPCGLTPIVCLSFLDRVKCFDDHWFHLPVMGSQSPWPPESRGPSHLRTIRLNRPNTDIYRDLRSYLNVEVTTTFPSRYCFLPCRSRFFVGRSGVPGPRHRNRRLHSRSRGSSVVSYQIQTRVFRGFSFTEFCYVYKNPQSSLDPTPSPYETGYITSESLGPTTLKVEEYDGRDVLRVLSVRVGSSLVHLNTWTRIYGGGPSSCIGE